MCSDNDKKNSPPTDDFVRNRSQDSKAKNAKLFGIQNRQLFGKKCKSKSSQDQYKNSGQALQFSPSTIKEQAKVRYNQPHSGRNKTPQNMPFNSQNVIVEQAPTKVTLLPEVESKKDKPIINIAKKKGQQNKKKKKKKEEKPMPARLERKSKPVFITPDYDYCVKLQLKL